MRKILVYSFLAVGALCSGCDDFLDREPIHQLNASEFFTSENDLKIYSYSFYENGLPSASSIATGDGMSDYAAVTTASTFLTGNWDATQQTGWGVSNWSALRNINYFLENAPKASVPENVLNHYLGLARFWRAWFYLGKVQTFGAVPWIETVLEPNSIELTQGRDNREFVMSKVLEDINFASENINPDKDSYSSTVNKYAALALKSRICLYEGTYRKYHTELGLTDGEEWLREAAKAAKSVMEAGVYSLFNTGNPSSDYRKIFTAEGLAGMTTVSKEVILARVYNFDNSLYHSLTWNFNSATNGSRWSLIRPFVNMYLIRDGSRFTDKDGYNEMEFIDEMKNRDYRLSQTIRTAGYTRSDGTVAPPNFLVTLTGYHMLKWCLDDPTLDGQGFSTNNIPIVRYAEVLLNFAEAKAELGEFGTAEWNESIKLLRDRAGVTSTEPATADPYLMAYFPGVTDKYILEVRRERGVELCFEDFRYEDLMRWKMGDLLDSRTMEWEGIYIPAMNTNYDLNGDGIADVCIVANTPSTATTGVKYVVLSSNVKLSEGDHGHILWGWSTSRTWEQRKYLRPIPESATLLNPNLLPQNEGWE